MKKMNEKGAIDLMVIALIVFFMATIGFVVWRINDTNDSVSKSSSNAESSSAIEVETQKPLDKEEQVEEQADKNDTQEQNNESDSTDNTPVPITQTSNITPFTASDCDGTEKTVYISNQNGAQASYKPPSEWNPILSFNYGDAITVYCKLGPDGVSLAPEYVLTNDAFILSSNLSTTRP